MEDQKEEVLTPYTLADRNEILIKYANFSFKEALAEVKDELKVEKDFHRRLGLLAAQSWILRKKLYHLCVEIRSAIMIMFLILVVGQKSKSILLCHI